MKHCATDVFPHVWGCGPNGFWANLLIEFAPSSSAADHVVEIFRRETELERDEQRRTRGSDDLELPLMAVFQLGVNSGPLAEEPMHGVALFVEVIRAEEGVG